MENTKDDLTDTTKVVCTRGHIYEVENLDKHGHDYFCPECFGGIDGSQVSKAQRGINEIDGRYLEDGENE